MLLQVCPWGCAIIWGMNTSDRYEALMHRVTTFAADRDWQQFHTPKNLAMALAGEAGELLAEFQWLTPTESQLKPDDPRYSAVEEEMADVFIYLIRLSEVLAIDLVEAADRKLVINADRYPVQLSRGRSDRPTT